MPDEVDELILKMQHLAAQGRAQREAEAHAQMADDPLFNKMPSSAPAGGSAKVPSSATPASAASKATVKPAAQAPSARDSTGKQDAPESGPRKTIGPRRRKGT